MRRKKKGREGRVGIKEEVKRGRTKEGKEKREMIGGGGDVRRRGNARHTQDSQDLVMAEALNDSFASTCYC